MVWFQWGHLSKLVCLLLITFNTHCRDKNAGFLSGGPNGAGCTAWVIYNENMDYLRCDDLSWDGKHECK